MRHFCRRAMVPVLALFVLSCASSSELARRSETALRSHDYDRAYREAKASLEKDSANGRARMALSAAATHLIDRDEERIVNLATLDTLEAAEACLALDDLRSDAVRFGATLPVHAEFASRALRIRTDAAGKLYRSALANTKQARPKQAYRELVGARRYVAGFKDIDTRIPRVWQQAVTRVAVLPFDDDTRVPGLARDIADDMHKELAGRVRSKDFEFTELVPAEKIYDQLSVSRLGALSREDAVALGRKLGADRVVWGRYSGLRTDSRTDRYQNSIWRKVVERDTSGRNVEHYEEVPFDATERWRQVEVRYDFEVIDTDDERTVAERGKDLEASAHTVYTDYLYEGSSDAYCLVPPTMKVKDEARSTRMQKEWKDTFKSYTVPKLLDRAKRDHSRRRYRPEWRDEFVRGPNDYPVFLDDLPSVHEMVRIALDDSWKDVLGALAEVDAVD